MSTPIPVILCGAMKGMANLIRTTMLPEYNGKASSNEPNPFKSNLIKLPVIYAGYNPTHTAHEVPLIISGNPPHPSSLHTQLSSNDFTIPPRAIITGGGYSNELFQELYQNCIQACGSQKDLPVPFFRTSNEITDRLAVEGKGPAHSSREYPAAVTERLKRKLREVGIAPGMKGDGGGGKGEVFFF